MKLSIKNIKNGTRLELVEEELQKATKPFVLGWLDYMRSQEEIIVTGLDGDMLEVNNSDDWGISEDSIGYFKKKEQSQYTFDDLIDVAVQANKDGMIRNVFLGSEHIDFDYGDEEYAYTTRDITSGVNFIKSLYKETFVIESMRDAESMSIGAMITLNNGEIVFYSGIDTNLIYVDSEDRDSIGLPFFVLKGATVTQSK